MSATAPTTQSLGGVPLDPSAPLLEVDGLSVEFRGRERAVNAVNGMSYQLHERETLAILGESGSGKSVSAQAVMGILDSPPGFITAGEVRFRGRDLLTLPESARREVRGERIAMVFQDALTALNPVYRVGWQIAEVFRKRRGMSRKEGRKRAIELLDRVQIPSAANRVDDYPHEFSGGMRQRAMIAMAIALDPEVLIADEPTTALDVTVQAQIMDLLAELQQQTGMGMVLITHDLGVVAEVADRVNVMYAGRVVEKGASEEIYTDPRHPYTLGLMHSIPRADARVDRLDPIGGQPPDLAHIPSGCPFHPRCPLARERCVEEEPPPYVLGAGRETRCHFHDEVREEARRHG